MTNKSINLIKNLDGKSKTEREEIIKKVLSVEFEKIKAQAKLFKKNSDSNEKMIETILNIENSEDLYNYLSGLSIVEISILSSYGLDIDYMKILKVSE